MDSKLLSFIAASFTSLLWTSLPSIDITILILFCTCLIIRKYQHLGCFLLGIVWMASVGHWQYTLQLSSEQTSRAIQIIGEVKSVVIADQNIRFNLRVTHIEGKALMFSRTFRLNWRNPGWQVQQGQKVKLTAKVKPPHGLANEAGFNYQQWLLSEGIVATGYVKSHPENQLMVDDKSVRQRLLNQMLEFDLSNSAWLAAITFGYRGLLQPADWVLVQNTGVAHLIAISGLHLALVASLSYVLIGWIAGALISRYNSLHFINLHNLAMLLTLLTTLSYSALAGFGLPTLRAWLMLLLFSVFFLRNKSLRPKSLILWALCAFILMFPLSLFGLSFWLSFSAVLIIYFIFWRWPSNKDGFSLMALLLGLLKIQLCLALLMLPLVAWQFSYVSLVSPVVNLIAVPIVTMILVPICITAVVSLAFDPQWALQLFLAADFIIEYGLRFLDFALTLNGAYFNLPKLPALVWLLVFVFVVCLCLPSFWLNKKYLWLLLLPLTSYVFTPQLKTWQIDILDVGQGVAVLITKNNRAIIYDVGASYPSGFNMADSVLLPLLQARGLTSNVDFVLLSHGDNDHAGSLPQLLKGIKPPQVLTNKTHCQKGLNLKWQGLRVTALWPDDAHKYNDNNGSCVIKVSDNFHSVLLPGDIDTGIEKQLVNMFPKQLQSDILLAPHHGSNTSSSSEFIGTVGAEYVIFSQGFMNRWRFPRQEVVNRYKVSAEPRLFSTSQSGQVSFFIESNSSAPIIVKTFRQDMYPYWYANSLGLQKLPD
ncbi:DNA internalization-related competence protein ComEC/Rec2 [Paraglaciecola arctica]|uniref:DNA internalization-related competence protein ComEC/Rec2 n=1 Tax=Paraglaciecola arctica TaxID=1128911 RepID=UPI001C073C75|nr:DNA internalization-related competence protein ComEC/Rec2 [Paraglaciecola arctica]MBU3001767.1 DNA internalization-related competence protein ComEC/Rec2 [Paraglaciecola arctica]